ncbi:hypothetical protein B0I35DRAFT_98998 [Stachybotrys elegans]|uniref:Zn(2)-C6 fungal-type domain-containing protein n=1 Tax=Stachybotrys elegans TaxID=80388 RepID=A0A8K0SL88_9HYPO|nr:hypothetical protein B0I35DRAFT_98998 [Stachybotrys elegans]
MSLRKTACKACVSSKRRCDRALPRCARCSKQSLLCQYPSLPDPLVPVTLPVSDRTVSSRIPREENIQRTPDILEQQTRSVYRDFGDLDGNAYLVPGGGDPFFHDQPSFNHVSHESSLHNKASMHLASSPHNSHYYASVEKNAESNHFNLGQVELLNRSIPPTVNNSEWPRGRDIETWTFCARELLSFVRSFATTASTTFIRQNKSLVEAQPLSPALQRALGVCAAHDTLGSGNLPVFNQILDSEVHNLMHGAEFGWVSEDLLTMGPEHQLLADFRRDLEWTQAMTLYQIIRLFSPDAVQRKNAENQMPLLATRTRGFLVRVQAAKYHPLFLDDRIPGHALLRAQLESAYRTILVSYLTHAVYTALVYQRCNILAELETLPMVLPRCSRMLQASVLEQSPSSQAPPYALEPGDVVPVPGDKCTTYLQFTNDKSMPRLDAFDRFFLLPLVACKGVDVLKG